MNCGYPFFLFSKKPANDSQRFLNPSCHYFHTSKPTADHLHTHHINESKLVKHEAFSPQSFCVFAFSFPIRVNERAFNLKRNVFLCFAIFCCAAAALMHFQRVVVVRKRMIILYSAFWVFVRPKKKVKCDLSHMLRDCTLQVVPFRNWYKNVVFCHQHLVYGLFVDQTRLN